MDYGKLAYLKAEELEARLAKSSSESFVPKFGVGTVTGVGGEKNVLLSVRKKNASGAVIVSVTSEADGEITLSFGGLAFARAFLTKGIQTVLTGVGGGNVTADLSKIKSGAKVSVRTLDTARTEEAEFRGATSIAENGGDYVICSCEDGDVVLTLTDSSLSKIYRKKTARGVHADVCAADGDYCLVYTDKFSTAWSLVLDSALNVIERACLGDSVGNMSVTARSGRVCAFFTDGGKAKYFSSAVHGGSRGRGFDCGFKKTVNRVTAVKDSDPIAAAVETGAEAYLVKGEREARADVRSRIRIRGRAEYV